MKIDLLSDALKLELKDLINEVLDERELEKKLNGPYESLKMAKVSGVHIDAVSWQRYTTYDTCM